MTSFDFRKTYGIFMIASDNMFIQLSKPPDRWINWWGLVFLG